MKMYSTNLTDNQWQVIEKIINSQVEVRGCNRGHNGDPPFPRPQGRRTR